MFTTIQRDNTLIAASKAGKVRIQAQKSAFMAVDPVELAMFCGCEVRFSSLDSLEGVYSPEPNPVIIIGSNRPAGRRSFNCSHELGHHIFGHGVRLSELESQRNFRNKPPEEVLADSFASNLLMPKTAVLRTLKDRGWSPNSLSSEQISRLASFFGVGYSTIINHMAMTLGLLDRQKGEIHLRIQPADIKKKYGVGASSELVFVDFHWRHRAIDLEVGDVLHLSPEITVDEDHNIGLISRNPDYSLFQALTPGITRISCEIEDWAANVRISRKNYEGLAEFRFLEDDNEC